MKLTRILPQCAGPGFCLAGLFLLCPSSVEALGPPSNANLYNRSIRIETNATTTVVELAEDLQTQIEEMTGVEFTITAGQSTADGIVLVRCRPDLHLDYPELAEQTNALAQLMKKGPEAYYLYSPGSHSLFLVGNSDAALLPAAYAYLWQLGWYALLPGDSWLEKPLRDTITLTVDTLEEPVFRQRHFFGTGGFGGSLPLDADGEVEADWTLWKQRNRFGGSISIGGHAGESFNTRNQAILEANANMRAYDDYPTSHVPFSVSMKPDSSDAALQTLYVSDRLSFYNPDSFAISVEPADGGGFCVCPSCTRYDPASSQVFGLAKRVADALDAAHPGAMVSLYAYNQHAAVPADPSLRAWLADTQANVYVQVAPYAFQQSGMTAADLARAWAAAKPNNRGIRDYWAITDWADCLPSQPFADIEAKVGFWFDLGYDSLNCESSYSSGSVGTIWNMAGRMLFDPSGDPVALRQAFYEMGFGPAAPVMQRMIERWGVEFTLSEQAVGLSFQDIAEARALVAEQPDFLARVNDYARYVQYIRLYHEYRWHVSQRYAIGSPERHAAAEAVLRWSWQIHASKMVHTYRMNQLILNRYEAGDDALLDAWNPDDATAAGWAWVRTNAVTDAVLDGIVAEGLADYATAPGPVPFDQPAYSKQLVPLDPDYVLSGELTAEARYGYRGLGTYVFYAKPGVDSLDFKFTPGNRIDSTRLNQVWVYDPGGSVVYSNWFGGNGIYGSNGVPVVFTINTHIPGNYTIKVNDPQKSYHLAADRNLPFVRVGKLTSAYWVGQKAYFYVPHGTTLASIYAPGALPVTIENADQVPVTPVLGNGIGQCNYPVEAGQDGRIWSLAELTCATPGAYPLNMPRIWSFSVDGSQHGMMVPSNAPPRVDAGLDLVIVAPTDTVSLVGRVVDDHLSPAPFCTSLWTQVSGPGTALFDAPTNAETSVSFDVYGDYVLRLAATDSGGQTNADTLVVTYTASPPNTAPVVDAGTNLTLTVSTSIQLEGAIEDDGQPAPGDVSCWWTEVRGPGTVLFDAPGNAHSSARFDQPGEYRLRLTATDGEYSSFNEVGVTVIHDYGGTTYLTGERGVFGTSEAFSFNTIGQTLSTLQHGFSARFRALETASVDRVCQRLIGVDANTTMRIGIMSDNGDGEPSGIYLASTAADFRPAVGDSVAWAVFTNTATLLPYNLYHVVTRPTALGAGESFRVYCSSGEESIRPFDRATDTSMRLVLSSDGGETWTVSSRNPYFTLGHDDTVVPGPGSAQQSTHATALQTRGGNGNALGQTFTISTREVPSWACVRFNAITFQARNVNAAHDLIMTVRDTDGTPLGTITVPSDKIASTMTVYTWPFDGGGSVTLSPGRRYSLTTAFSPGSGTSEYYYFLSSVSTSICKENSWGGTQACVPLACGGGNWDACDWVAPPLYPSRSEYDLWFRIDGDVLEGPQPSRGGSLLILQ